jgi:hypothetical protein
LPLELLSKHSLIYQNEKKKKKEKENNMLGIFPMLFIAWEDKSQITIHSLLNSEM